MLYKRLLNRIERLATTRESKLGAIEAALNSYDIIIPTSDNKIDVINANDIYYVHQPKAGIVYIQTSTEKIEYTNKSCNLLEYCVNQYPFMRHCNNGLIININEIVSYDSFMLKVYFNNNVEVVVTKAAINNMIAKILGRSCDVHEDTFFGRFKHG